MKYDSPTLDAVFGSASSGDDPQARAGSSTRLFVRSQMQLGFDTPSAKGRRLTAAEALDLAGYDALKEVAAEGRAHLFRTVTEPSSTLAARRRDLGFSARTVAERAGVTVEQVHIAETSGTLSSIHVLENIARVLVLDERRLTTTPGAGGDAELGLQLRPLQSSGIGNQRIAAVLAEAAWVVGRQSDLRDRGGAMPAALARFAERSDDYEYRTFERGYRLAARTRAMLGLGDADPILSVRALAEDVLELPIIEAPLGHAIAGATIVNDGRRGIVLSSMLTSTNKVLLRRTTIAHELGHALWDPEWRLGRIKVDTEKSISSAAPKEQDRVEMRARSFAIALLAPTVAIRGIYRDTGSVTKAIDRIVMEFGLSAAAALFHLKNVCRLGPGELPSVRTPSAAHALWGERERRPDGGSDPQPASPMRGGRFAELVVATWREGRISDDTASSWLGRPIRRASEAG